MNAFVVERLLSGTFHHLARFTTSTVDWTRIESGSAPPEITFAHLSTANLYYGLFSELQEGPSPTFRIIIVSIITPDYSKYGELIEGPEDQLTLDNNEIAGDVGDVRKAEDKEETRNTGDTEEAGNAGDVEDARDVANKEAGKYND